MSKYNLKYVGQEIDSLLDKVHGWLQPDWNESDPSKSAYIKNKPTKVGDFTNDRNYQSGAEVDAKVLAHHDGTKQDVISDLDTIRSGATAGSTAVQPSTLTASYRTAVNQDLIDDSKADADEVEGEIDRLDERIDGLSAMGRYLSTWNATTGKPETDPTTVPYIYHAGDYYVVSVVGTTNYKPSGTEYTGAASTVVESASVYVGDYYRYDGQGNWVLAPTATRSLPFASITGNATDNVSLAAALNERATPAQVRTVVNAMFSYDSVTNTLIITPIPTQVL